MKLQLNDGRHPSRLDLGRAVAGEIPIDPAHEAATAAAREEAASAPVAPFDPQALRARAAALPDVAVAPPALPPAANTTWRWVLSFAAMAAAVLFFAFPKLPGNHLKGDVDLGFYVMRDGQVTMGDPEATVRPGDRLQFSYRSGQADHLILVSVDGTGRVSVFYPERGEEGVEVIPGERHVLDGSVELDDAPGPEVFVAFFGDWSVTEARAAVTDAWAAGELDTLDDDHPDVALLALEKE